MRLTVTYNAVLFCHRTHIYALSCVWGRWCTMSKVLNNRSENDIKNKWNSMRRKSLRKPKVSKPSNTENIKSSNLAKYKSRLNAYVPRDWTPVGRAELGKKISDNGETGGSNEVGNPNYNSSSKSAGCVIAV
jgi:hypothetical protein